MVVNRLCWPEEGLPPDAARSLLQITFAPEDQERMQLLARKAQEGTLSPAEREESCQYDLLGHLLAILHSRARQALRKKAQ
jgi:hypothetical protein